MLNLGIGKRSGFLIVATITIGLTVFLFLIWNTGPRYGIHSFPKAVDVDVGVMSLPADATTISLSIALARECMKFQVSKESILEWLQDVDKYARIDGIVSNVIAEDSYPSNSSTFYSLFKETGWAQPEDLIVFSGQPKELHCWFSPKSGTAYVVVAR